MKKLRAFYFSGTGNTRFVTKYLINKLACDYDVRDYDIAKENRNLLSDISEADLILIAFPIYASAPPIPMRNFIHAYQKEWKNKTVAIAETQYFFSGDGAASIGRTLEKFGADVAYAEQFNMPNNLADSPIFKVHNEDELEKTLNSAIRKMDEFSQKIIESRRFRRGFNPVSHAVGYYCQRKWWRKGESEKRNLLKIDENLCIGCGKCVKNCPVGNISLAEGKAKGLGKCVFCYRCVNLCPKSAITLFGKKTLTAYRGVPEDRL